MTRTNPTHRRITLHDVAQYCGVSYQTVSRVVNNNPHVSKETRRRVLRAIKDMNYQPNHVARSLVTRRSNLLEVITFGSNHYGPSQMVAHVERAARLQGYNLILTNISEMSLDEIRAAINSLSGRLVDGLIMITPVAGVEFEELADLCDGIPFVMIDTQLGSTTPSVVINQRHGSQLATQHLIEIGHRAICEISGPLNWYGANARHESWRDTLMTAGITPGPSVEGDWTAVGGYAAARRLIESGANYTALVVGNDQMALGAMRALRESGLRVPEDVSVVGFDDIPEAVCFEPPLTTIRQDFDLLGSQSVEYLLDLMKRPDTPLQQRVLYPTLIERQSTRPPGQP
ncbi:MAG: substrate-binding domain-containing protein [Chloroflexi bacterium]|nr:substrate-binding domain-containing protein [Chloroflexota bacterium]